MEEHLLTPTLILDAVVRSLTQRNRDRDDELATIFWAPWLENHAAMLRELEEDNDAKNGVHDPLHGPDNHAHLHDNITSG